MKTQSLFPPIETNLKNLNFNSLSAERKEILQSLIDYIQLKVINQREIRLNFICTHNSRRSHLSQVWAQAAATYYGIPNVFCYSGGTEATAMFPMAAKTLEKAGFQIQTIANGTNPIYAIKYAENAQPIIGFSKTYDDAFNPKSEFAAIVTCSQADGGCPFIEGAEKRIPIMFEDPKAFDNTPQQAEKYEERSLQIATEMSYVFSQIKK
ncbi:protein-tyrosine-phosphatase [Flavobacterium sp.]|uniref:arsenate-mycothiol transferase ArsC n=1 Tax=Flavobacterium sp. TaxID=239 RepID=UPI0025C5E9DD|nr:protein-tyrosine-phosphatase [Flavobacterium sp.]MBA4152900.1 protein-tyrosine-phosphatase [Flavobacterium sp.]